MKATIRLGLVLVLLLGVAAMAMAQAATGPEPVSISPATAPVGGLILPGEKNELRRPVPGPGARVAVIVFDGTVDEFAQTGFERRLKAARESGANVIVIQINTYGGLVTVGLDVARLIKRQDNVHVIAFVDEKAYSAGSLIAVACDEIVMEPSTVIGDCGVIRGDGQAIEGETERAKFESPVMAEFMASADRNGYSKALLAAFVQSKRSVHFVQHAATGEKRFFDATSYAALDKALWKPVEGVADPLDGPETIFTVDNAVAERIGLSQGTFASPEALAKARGWTVIGTHRADFGEGIVGFLGGDIVRGLLIAFLIACIFWQFKLPGTGVTESAIAIALGLLLIVPFMTGYAQWYEIVMVLLGVALIAVEIFILPGFGVAGISGLVLLLAGLVMTFLPPLVAPQLPAFTGVSTDGLRSALTAVVGGMLGGFVLWVLVGKYLPSIPYANRLILQATSGSQAMVSPGVPSNAVAFPALNATGAALTDLRPGGTARFADAAGMDQTIDVVSDRGFVSAGTQLVVTEVHGNRVVVRPA